ncbi:MAG: aldo/keto reductase [Cytophagaceae bacterium]
MKYRLLGKSALRVSEFCLGTMGFGPEWGWGADYETSKQVFDAYANAGGNFIDTANRYTEGSSEWYVGDFTKQDRDHFVVATKYTLHDRMGDPNFSGNHKKNLQRSVRESLKRLQTDFIDLLWVHAWDFTVRPDELMRALEDMIKSGQVTHIGISDTPAWIVAQCNTIAELRGWSAFTALQVEYSLLQRTPERDLIPMAKAFDMAITPWAPLAGGALTGKYLNAGETAPGRLKEGSARLNDYSKSVTQVVVDVANEIGVSPSHVAIQWTRQREETVVPIIGAKKPEQIIDSIEASKVILSPEQLKKLNEVSKIELGFPHDFLLQDGVKQLSYSGERQNIIDLKR